MKWFKHISDSLDDPFIQDLIDEFGSDGYLVFFGTLEILARELKIESPGKVEVSRTFFRRKVRLSWHKCSTILKFCEKEGRFFVIEKGRKIEINCPKFKDMCDDWTSRMLRSGSVVAPKKHRLEEEVEEDKDKKHTLFGDEGGFYITKRKRKLNGKRYQTFKIFWEIFDFKHGKAEAGDAWLDIPTLTDALVMEINEGAKREAKRRPELIQQGKTPKFAQGWITGKRWEDEIKSTAPEREFVCK